MQISAIRQRSGFRAGRAKDKWFAPHQAMLQNPEKSKSKPWKSVILSVFFISGVRVRLWRAEMERAQYAVRVNRT